MFKISIVETQGQRRLVVEGQLISPWAAKSKVHGKKPPKNSMASLVIDLANVTLISREGEDMLLQLMKDGAKFTCRGVLFKHMLKQLARRCRCKPPVDVDFERIQTTNR